MAGEGTDPEVLRLLQEATVGINLVADHLADVERALFELNVSVQVSLSVQRKQLLDSGMPKEQVDSSLARIEVSVREALKAEVSAAKRSVSEKQQRRGDSDIAGAN